MPLPTSLNLAELDPAPRRCLELAHQALLAGGLPVGAVLVDADHRIVAEGRNEVYDTAGDAVLRGSPLAHAELDAIARLTTADERAGLRCWSSHRPCSMCAAALAFLGIDDVRYIAEDPSGPIHLVGPPPATALGDRRWAEVATVLFLLGCSARVLAAAEPVTPALVEFVRSGAADALRGSDLAAALARLPLPESGL